MAINRRRNAGEDAEKIPSEMYPQYKHNGNQRFAKE